MQAVGRYRLQEEIGRGANGVVYRAWDPERKEDVAVKILTEIGKKKRARFRTEVSTLARLRHPNLVTVLAYGEHKDRPYLVMDYVRGGSLQSELEQRGGIAPGRAVELAHALAQAVAYAQSCGVIHRDIKPDNVLLTNKGEPKLTDFGLARDLHATHARLTKTQASMGTPGYWAPEQAGGKGEKISELTDVYGLGATLYAMLTGGPPIQGRGYLEVVQRTMTDAPIPPSRLVPEVWPELEALCLRALEKEPERRFPSVTTFARELHACLRAPQTRPAPRVPWRVVGAVVAVLGVVGLVVALASGGDERDAPPEEPGSQVARSPLEEQGLSAYAARDFDALGTIADQLLAKHPESPVGRLWRGTVRGFRKDFDQSREDLSFAYTKPETRAQAAMELARVHLANRDSNAAEDWARRALELREESGEASWILAQALLDQERRDEAVRVLEVPSQREGELQFQCCMLRNEVLMTLKRYGEAEDGLQRAARLRPSESGPHRLLAMVCMKRKRFDEAEEHFARALQASSKDEAAVLNDRARFRLLSRNPEGAIRDAQRAVELAPSKPGGHLTLGRILLTTGQAEASLESFKAVLRLDPDHAPALLASGEALFDTLRCPEAIAVMTRLIELEPEHPAAYLVRAMAASEMGDWGRAISDMDRVITLEGGSVAASYATLGTLYRESGRLREALVHYERALAIDRGFSPASYGRALCLMFVPGRRAEVLAELRASVDKLSAGPGIQHHWIEYLARLPADREPFTPLEWLAQGRAQFERREFVAAALCFNHALELGAGGERGEALYLAGKCYALLGELQPAELSLTRSLWAQPNGMALLSRAMIRHDRNDLRGSLSDYDMLLKRGTKPPTAFLGRGAVLAKLGELERAKTDFEDYIRRRPEDPQGWANLALTSFDLRDFSGTVHAATKALELGPPDAEMMELRGTSFMVGGEFKRALGELSRALELDPSRREARAMRMLVLQNLNEHRLAVEDGRALLSAAPQDPRYLATLAMSLQELGERAEALELLRRAVSRLDPGSQDHAKLQAEIDLLVAELRSEERSQ